MEDIRAIEKSKAINAYEAELIEAYIYNVVHTKANIKLTRMRYVEILNLAQKREKLIAKRLKPLRDLVSVEVLEKGFDTLALNKPFITFPSRITNHGTQNISQLKGDLHIRFKSGRRLKKIKLRFQDSLAADTQVQHVAGYVYFRTNREDNIIKDTPLSKLDITWYPRLIRLADGRELHP